MDAHVSIIILNWNGWEDTIECLESLYYINYPNYDIIVVDNGSENESLQKIKEYAEGKLPVESGFFKYNSQNKPLKIIEYSNKNSDNIDIQKFRDIPSNQKLTLIKNDKNEGYALGNNIGLEYVLNNLKSDYIVTINNDTVVDKDFLKYMVKYAKNNDKIGLIGPKIYYYGVPGSVWFAGGNFRFLTCDIPNIENYDDECEVDFITGCIHFFRTDALKKIGLYNPTYAAGYDNLEICFRAKNSGYKVFYLPQSEIWHKVGRSRIEIEKNPEKYQNEMKDRGISGLKSRLRMFKENTPIHYHPFQTISCFTYIPLKMLYQTTKDPTNPSTLKTIVLMLIKYYSNKFRS